jgi:hypothetical protein
MPRKSRLAQRVLPFVPPVKFRLLPDDDDDRGPGTPRPLPEATPLLAVGCASQPEPEAA